MCKVQNERRKSDRPPTSYMMCANTQVSGRKTTNKQQLSSCLCLFRTSSLQCGRCVSKFSFSPCIYTEYFSNIWETRGPPALIGDLWLEGEAWNMYTTVVTVASRLSEWSGSRILPVKQISTSDLGGGGGYTHCVTHSGCIQKCATLNVDSKTVAPVRCFSKSCVLERFSCFSSSLPESIKQNPPMNFLPIL